MTVKQLASAAEPWTYAAMRIVMGAFLAFHGAQKVLGWHGSPAAPFSQMWAGGCIELAGGTLIALGLFTRCAAFVCSGEMAVAYFQFHWRFVFAGGMWIPALNKGELAAAYCFVFLFIAARGSGVLSLDALRGKSNIP